MPRESIDAQIWDKLKLGTYITWHIIELDDGSHTAVSRFHLMPVKEWTKQDIDEAQERAYELWKKLK